MKKPTPCELEGTACLQRGYHRWKPLVQDGGALHWCADCGYRPARAP